MPTTINLSTRWIAWNVSSFTQLVFQCNTWRVKFGTSWRGGGEGGRRGGEDRWDSWNCTRSGCERKERENVGSNGFDWTHSCCDARLLRLPPTPPPFLTTPFPPLYFCLFIETKTPKNWLCPFAVFFRFFITIVNIKIFYVYKEFHSYCSTHAFGGIVSRLRETQSVMMAKSMT